MNTARKKACAGFTFTEIFLAIAILAISLGFSTPYLFGVREKIILQGEQEKIVADLHTAQQNAISAQGGYDYSLEFQPLQHSYLLQPGAKRVNLHPQINIEAVSPSIITYRRLTGQPDTSLDLTLTSRRFFIQISVSSHGVISSTNPERQ